MEDHNLSGNSSPYDDGELRRRKLGILKKQLSKVDLKLKFQPRTSKRSCSVFYTEKEYVEESPISLSPEEEIPTIKVPDFEVKPERPKELPLFDDMPVPPPRREKKETPKRDTRLLSVPNIKYHSRGNQGLSSLMRKISKLIYCNEALALGLFLLK